MKHATNFLLFALISGTLFAAVASSSAADPQKDEQAIREVLDGTRKTAHAAWWGFLTPTTRPPRCRPPSTPAPRRSSSRKCPDPGSSTRSAWPATRNCSSSRAVVVLAKRGGLPRQVRLALQRLGRPPNSSSPATRPRCGCTAPTTTGPTTTRPSGGHVLNFHGCTNVTVAGLTLAESGGDGIYLGAGRNGATNRNVVIRDVVCDRNYRQGISVITAENLLIENCILRDTGGTAPQAGIDFEPQPPHRTAGPTAVMRGCTIEDNQGYALHVYAGHLDATSAPDLHPHRGLHHPGHQQTFGQHPSPAAAKRARSRETIELIRCRFEGPRHHRHPHRPRSRPKGVRVRLGRVHAGRPGRKADPSPPRSSSAPAAAINSRPVASNWLTAPSATGIDRLPIHQDDFSGKPPPRRPPARLPSSTRAKAPNTPSTRSSSTAGCPYDPVVEIPRVSLEGLSLVPVGGRRGRPGRREAARPPAPRPRRLPGPRREGRPRLARSEAPARRATTRPNRWPSGSSTRRASRSPK